MAILSVNKSHDSIDRFGLTSHFSMIKIWTGMMMSTTLTWMAHRSSSVTELKVSLRKSSSSKKVLGPDI